MDVRICHTIRHRSPLGGQGGRGGRGDVSGSQSKRRLLGIDRSGPQPPATKSDQPLHPWTVPNAIGYARLAGIPVFLVVALSSEDGHSAVAAALFAVIGWADYLDGFAARLTGQYSRLGALLDPVIDRLLVISGMVVCWHFQLLPRWAIALVVARELFVLALSRYGLRRGIELKINWPGRLGVAPTLGAPFFAIAGVHWLALILLYVGLALSLVATALYLRDGAAQLRDRKAH
jgi:cardiolipin synthase